MRKNRDKTVPWSAYDDLWLRRTIYFDFFAMLIFVVLGSASAALRFWGPMSIFFIAAALFFFDQSIQLGKYNAMLRNKPRSVSGLTEWVQLRPWQTEICCACGTIVHIDGAPWFPNPVDPGGGRYSIVCPCGIGYYKLKETVTRLPAKGSAKAGDL